MPGAPRRPELAVLPSERIGDLRVRYLQHYAQHPKFQRALVTLYEEHVAQRAVDVGRVEVLQRIEHELPDGEWKHSYVQAVHTLAARFGLDRFCPLNAPDGAQLIHSWCQTRALYRIHDVAGITKTLADETGQGGALEDWSPARFGLDPAVTVGDPRTIGGDGVLAWPQGVARKSPVVRISVNLALPWDPREQRFSEVEKVARAEFERQVAAERKRIDAETAAAVYGFPDTKPNIRRDLGWLFQHVALKMSYVKIALDADARQKTVENRVAELARELGVSLRRTPRRH